MFQHDRLNNELSFWQKVKALDYHFANKCIPAFHNKFICDVFNRWRRNSLSYKKSF